MFRVLLSLMILFPIGAFAAADNNGKFTSCGPGYILTTHARIEGIPAYKCQKLWCRDLETGKPMGSGDNPNNGYKDVFNTLCDASGTCLECFGDRKWCANMRGGHWDEEYGAYMRDGTGSAYTSYLMGSCWTWKLGKPTCADGETAIERNGEWVCVTPSSSGGATGVGSHSSSIRRTGTLRRL